MSEGRPKLSLRGPDLGQSADLVRASIERQMLASAVYNKSRIVFAPHALYYKNDDHHVDAVVTKRDGQPPREPKIGTYKLSGLKALKLTNTQFHKSDLFDRTAPQYSGGGSILIEG